MPKFQQWQEWAVPIAILAGLFVILTPLPTLAVDFLLVANMLIAIMILSSALLTRSATELSVFPAILLISTLGRLVLNISTTRLILSDAKNSQDLAAGGLIKSFGEYVIGNEVFVGLVIFAIIFVVQFVVVTKGSSRISEVAARFALDGMPGKQMAIDADLKAKIITPHQAKESRESLQEQADFLGAMDGAGRFVRGDAIAGLIITMVNILGGLAIGLASGMSFSSAVEIYTKLTIGDGLASQLPAFLIAIAAGVLMARGSRPGSVSSDLVSQVVSDPRVLFLAAIGAAGMAFAGLPQIPLFCIGGTCAFFGYRNHSKIQKDSQEAARIEQQKTIELKRSRVSDKDFEDLMKVSPLEIRLGVGIVKIARGSNGSTLISDVDRIRRELVLELGFILPKVRIADDVNMRGNRFQVLVSGDLVAEGEIQLDSLLAVDQGNAKGPILGKKAQTAGAGPGFEGDTFGGMQLGESGFWIDPDQEHRAEFMRYKVLTPIQIISEYLRMAAIRFAADLFSRDSAGRLIDELKKTSPLVVEELIPQRMSLSQVQQILKNLLSEQVSIRQLALILETLGDYSPYTNHVGDLTERVRQKLSRNVCSRLATDRVLNAIELERPFELQLIEQATDSGSNASSSGPVGADEFRWLVQELQKHQQVGKEPVLIVDPEIRGWFRANTAAFFPGLHVIARSEVCDGFEICRVAEVSLKPRVKIAA